MATALFRTCVVFALLVLSPRLAFAGAADIVVDRLDDPMPDGCSPGSCSLREAVSLANSRGGADRIVLPSGDLQLARAGAGEDSNDSGDLDVTESLELVGEGVASTSILQTTADRLFDVYGSGTLALRNVRLENGSGVAHGGAIRVVYNATLELRDAVLRNHRATELGGAIYHDGTGVWDAAPKLRVTRTLFDNNVAQSAAESFGGAAYIVGSGSQTSYLLIEDSRFENNRAGSGGGAVEFEGLQSVSNLGAHVVGSTFVDNRATSAESGGGAIGMGQVEGGSVQLTVSNSVFDGNAAATLSGNGGGALRVGGGRPLRVHASTFLGNSAVRGGAIRYYSPNAAHITDSTFCDNRAEESGGALDMAAATLIERSTFCDNDVTTNETSDLGGGAIAARQSFEPSLTVRRSTFDNNDALRGGAIAIEDAAPSTAIDVELTGNTLVARLPPQIGALGTLLRYNPATSTAALTLNSNILRGRCSFASAGVVPDSAMHNLEGPLDTCRTGAATQHANNQTGLDSQASDLAPLADNGGPTLTRLPRPGSVAIDVSSNALCTTLDQRGYVRTDDNCDVGAIEVEGIPQPAELFRDGFEVMF